MITAAKQASSEGLPLLPALAAMTVTQALVALILFAPGVLAPKLGLSVDDVSLFATAVFAVGMATSLYGGVLAERIGPCRVAAFCAAAVVIGAFLAAQGTAFFLLLAGLVVGLAFGPETPASSTLLNRLSRPEQRPLVFSVRQTGNQIGAILGSLTLPTLALISPGAGYGLIIALGVLAFVALLRLSARYDKTASGTASLHDMRSAIHLVARHRGLSVLALLAVPFSGMQLALNAYLVSFAVSVLSWSHVHAGLLLGLAQTGGLAGRLLWGIVATRLMPARAILIGLGLAMALAAFTIGLAGAGLPLAILLAVTFIFGLTASGWNGVFLAEVARLAPQERTAEATGGVLTAAYGGLLLAPIFVSWMSAALGLGASYIGLGLLAALATLFMWASRDE